MKSFDIFTFDFRESQKEVAEFRQLLQTKSSLKERDDILPFFRDRPQLCAMCSVLGPARDSVDRIALEYDLFGDFACDLVLGSWDQKAYSFIEFEDAQPESIFKQIGRKASRDWSSRSIWPKASTRAASV